ncbi:amidohydrolase family protein [Subtercola sp. YIM 133946]|uniref:amidohydrolase family protein n=1 Tax=Subtercola sp. YIM 133946 TaxID=3118909 RepID=UPI002F945470
MITNNPLRTLIRGASILSVDPVVGTLPRGDILIEGDRILAVDRDLTDQAGPAATVIDADRMIAIPGFVDSHVHAWEGQLRGIDPQADFGAYLGITAFGIGPRYRPEDNYAGTLATALVALDAGITTVIDNSHNSRSPELSRAAIRAFVDAGIRGVHAVGAPFGASFDHIPGIVPALRDEFEGPLMTLRLYEVNPSAELWQFANDEGLWVSTELGTHTPGLGEIFDDLEARGLLTGRHAFNHGYDLSERVWDQIAGSGAAVNMAPRSDAAFGLGTTIPPIDRALCRSIPVGLSGDNEITYGLSMFAEMQNLNSRHRSEVFRRQVAGETEAQQLSAAQLLEFATLGGAKNAGLADTVGSLTPGKQADIVLIRADEVNTFPATDALATVTAFATSSNVDTVFVAGQLRKRHGRLVDIDVAEAQELIVDSRNHLLAPVHALQNS